MKYVSLLLALLSTNLYAQGLYGGRPIREGELKPSIDLGYCTATLVGAEVLLTAGHCKPSGSIQFSYMGKRYSGPCQRHPDYNRGGFLNNDFTLCKISPKISLPLYGDLSPIPVSVGDGLIMQGYGAGSGSTLNVGESKVYELDDQDIITQGRVNLGSGDSGGALFAKPKTNDLVNGPLIMVGINSRGDRRNHSYFNRVNLDRSQSFFKSWAQANQTVICGVNVTCQTIPGDKCKAEQEALLAAEDELAVCLAGG